VVAGGFAGYFIPFNSLSVDVVERNRQKNLKNQNIKLQSEIRPMKKLLENLSDEIRKLEEKRKGLSEKLGMKDAGKPQTRRKSKAGGNPGIGNLLNRAKQEDVFFNSFSEIIAKHPGYFDSIPLIKPVSNKPIISARFDREKDPFTLAMKNHFGVDFVAPRGTPVISSASGMVTRVEDDRIWGKRITVSHAFGFSTVYAHLGTVDVSFGKKVRKGDCIATMGLSGMTSGPHLHYEIWYRGNPVNPEDLFFPVFDSLIITALR
jgi:murein DD-endopeptidase MepM/ murein hydrolase activator NlpD